jgi:LEA14-like dessication related protein
LSENLTGTLFRGGDEQRMIVFANKPIDAGIYLGDQLAATDVWGRSLTLDIRSVGNVPTQFLSIGKWPVILSNVDHMLAQWQVNAQIENPTIENRVGQSDPLLVRLQNPESRTVRGTIEVVAPLLLQQGRSTAQFEVPANTSTTVEVPMRLRYDASQTLEPLDIVVTFNETPPRKFVIQRQVQVGLKDFQLETQVRMDNVGNIIIELEILNLGDQIANFDCMLVLPNRPREKFQIIRLEDRHFRPIVIADGAELKGQSILLRCEEIRSGRVLNHRIEIK